MGLLDDVLERLGALSDEERQEVEKLVSRETKGMIFVPQEGPQTEAYLSQADILLFGGSPGGGKTALEVGLALNEHHRCLVVRREFVDLGGVLHTLDNITGVPGSATGGNRPVYRKEGGGIIEFMGIGGGFGGKQGNPHDYIAVDEAAQITEHDFRMLMGWLRTDRPGQRCRAVLGSNPPLDEVGDWLLDYFGAWLDPTHPNPAEEGELRWFLPIPNNDRFRECESHETETIAGVLVSAQSRTFISSKFTDNKYYDGEQYAKTLAGLPATVRDRLISGDFMRARNDDEWQVIPTEWVRDAQARWTKQPPPGIPMCAIGADIAQGGADNTVLAPRHDSWFAPLVSIPGSQTPTGADAGGKIMSVRRGDALVIVDVGGGWGADTLGHLKENNIPSLSHLGVAATEERTNDKAKLKFGNVRSMVYWRFREALDPSQTGGSQIALPPSKQLLTDLTALRFEIRAPGVIHVTPKDQVKKRLGRSTDEGDAVVMSWSAGAKMGSHYKQWQRRGAPSVVMHRPTRR